MKKKIQLNRIKRIIGWLIKKGKKGNALKILNNILIILKIETGQNPEAVLNKALDNIKPVVGLRRFKKSGLVYWIPYLLNNKVSDFMALKWLFKFSKLRNDSTISNKLAYEIIDAFNNEGSCYKEKLKLYEIANENRVYLQVFLR